MKRILSVLLIAGLTFGTHAQDKKIRGGLVTGFTMNSLKTQTTKIEKNGIGPGFTIGMNGDYRINDNIAIASGIEFNLESFRVNYGDNSSSSVLGDIFYSYTDTDINKIDNGLVSEATDSTAFNLMGRKFKSKYVTIPLFLKFQTNMIGSMKYYGKFGLRTSFLAGVRMDDEGYESKYNQITKEFNRTGTNPITKTDMKPLGIKKGLSPFRMGIGMYGGTEWNFTGNTFLFAEAGFNYGVTPVLWQESGHLSSKTTGVTGNPNTYENLNVKSNPMHTFELKIGLLF